MRSSYPILVYTSEMLGLNCRSYYTNYSHVIRWQCFQWIFCLLLSWRWRPQVAPK